MPSSYMSNSEDLLGGYGFGGDYEGLGYDQMIGTLGQMGSSEIKILEFQNFLRTPPLSLFNLVPQGENAEVSFTANLKPYTQLYVLAIDQNSVALRQLDLGS